MTATISLATALASPEVHQDFTASAFTSYDNDKTVFCCKGINGSCNDNASYCHVWQMTQLLASEHRHGQPPAVNASLKRFAMHFYAIGTAICQLVALMVPQQCRASYALCVYFGTI
jgi:hypothetical protein